MTFTTPDNSKKIFTTVLILLLSNLACVQAVVPFTPTAPAATIAPLVTHTPAPTDTRTTAPSATDAGTAKVKAAVVNVRQLPNGDVIGHLEAGQSVTVIDCADSWCEVRTGNTHGYIFEGCLDLDTPLRCEAR